MCIHTYSRTTDELYTDVELPLKPLLFHVLISRPYVVCMEGDKGQNCRIARS